jgi:hypothetical protein
MKFQVGDFVRVRTKACSHTVRVITEVDNTKAFPYTLHVPPGAADITRYWKESELQLVSSFEVASQ